MKDTFKEVINEWRHIISTWIIWVASWMAYYFYQVNKWEQFKRAKLLITMFLAFWVALIVWNFIPETLAFRDWVIWICSFSTHWILPLIEKAWPKLFSKITK